MHNESAAAPKENTHIIKRNRFFGLIIVLIVVAPMIVAYIMYHTGWGVSHSTTNKGELLNPVLPIQELSLTGNKTRLSELFSDNKAGKKWRLLVPVAADCSDICQKNLYTTRQVHIRLAEKAYRLERILLAIDTLSETVQTQLQQEHPNTIRVETSAELFDRWLSAANRHVNAEQYYYLIDQDGFAMMRYDVSHTGHDLLDDIKKLLKFTYDK
jgi:cytochrome oxidase Cu insertion factor (SCO1/SenC/PrrC family)